MDMDENQKRKSWQTDLILLANRYLIPFKFDMGGLYSVLFPGWNKKYMVHPRCIYNLLCSLA